MVTGVDQKTYLRASQAIHALIKSAGVTVDAFRRLENLSAKLPDYQTMAKPMSKVSRKTKTEIEMRDGFAELISAMREHPERFKAVRSQDVTVPHSKTLRISMALGTGELRVTAAPED